MKKTVYILIGMAIALALFGVYFEAKAAPTAASVDVGGTGLRALKAGYIPFGAGVSPFATSSALFWASTANRLSYTYGSSTAISATTVCLSTDCRTAWPSVPSLPISISNGGTAATSQTTNGVNYFDGSKITSDSTLTFSPTGFGGTYAQLLISNSAIPVLNLQTNTTATDGNGPVIFFSSPTGPVWQFYMPSTSQGFGSFNRVLFQYAIYSSLNNDTVLGATTGATPPTIGSRLVIKGQDATSAHSGLNVTDSNDTSLFFVRDDGAITASSLGSGIVKSTSGTLGNATAGTDYAPATSGASLLYGNGSGGFSNATVGTGLSFTGGTLSATGGGGGGTISTSSNLTAGLLVQSTGVSTIANIATSSLGLLTTNVAEGTNLYYTNTRFDNRLSATTSLPNITTLAALSLPYSQLTGTPTTFGYPFPSNATSTALTFNAAFTVLNPSTSQGAGTYLGTDATHGIKIGYYNANNYALWAGGVTPGATNYGFLLSNSGTSAQFNSTDNIEFNISDSSKIILDNTGAVTLTSLTNGLVKSTSGKLSNAANGTDYTLVTANTCGAGQFFSAATAAGVFTCGTPSGGSTFPFTPLTNFGVNTSATTTALWAQNGIFASSTSVIASTTFAVSGNVGIGTTSPYAQFSIGGGNLVIGAATAGGTAGDLFLPKLGTAAGTILAVDATGKVIATTTPSGGGSNYWTLSGNNISNNNNSGNGFVGVGSSTPYAQLSLGAPAGNTPYFSIGSTTLEVFKIVASSNPFYGLGTTSPFAAMSINSGSGQIPFAIAVNGAQKMEIDINGHLITGGSSPSCGTGCASVTGDDRTMRIITNSGVTSITVNFAASYPTAPICIATEDEALSAAVDASTTISTVVLTSSVSLTTRHLGLICQTSSNFTY